ncbi:MAG TPA: hypothetical protein PKA37_04955 [Planctomycetota bacterium]|nr:hypothetical protein [Planctomycetota bacterium]
MGALGAIEVESASDGRGAARLPGKVWYGAVMAASALLIVHGAWTTSPWEDEFHSLLPDALVRYRSHPIYYVYLEVARTFTDSFLMLRLWSALPFLLGLALLPAFLRRVLRGEREAFFAWCFVALNPYLLHEAFQIRYYGFSFLTAVLSLRAGYILCVSGGSALVIALALLALLVNALVISSAALLSVWILLLALWAPAVRSWSLRIPVLLAAFGSLCAGALHFRWEILEVLKHGPSSLLDRLPLVTGYHRGPVDLSTVAWQYEKLLGWNTLEGWIPSAALGIAAMTATSCALVLLLSRIRALRGVLLGSLLLPAVVCGLALFLVNFINPRYYLHAAIPLAIGQGLLVAGLVRSRHRVFALPALLLLLAVQAGALVRGVTEDQTASMDRILNAVKEHRVEALVVHPLWYGYHVQQHLDHAGLSVSVLAREALDGDLPVWLFVKDPRYVWPKRKITPPARLDLEKHYSVVARAPYLRKYYFHPPVCEDRLLRLKR